MRIVRFDFRGKIRYGILDGDVIFGLRYSPFTRFKGWTFSFLQDRTSYNMDDVRLLAPCLPSKIVGVGLNYRSHSEEFRLSVPSEPLIFLKPSTAVVGPDGNIVVPQGAGRVDYEGELGVVIGRLAKNVSRDSAGDYVLGYLCINDVSERHMQKRDGQWTRAKGFDTFAPLGPWIETEVNPDDLKLETYLNGELRQSARTSDLVFGVSELVSFISKVMTLLPGDVIATGTPSGVGPLKHGDVVEVKIENIGTLRSYVVSQSIL